MNRIRKKYNRIFKESFIEYKLESFEISKEELSEKKAKIQDFINFIKSGKIKDYNEEQLQARFATEVFEKTLGYKNSFNETWEYELERKTDVDGQKPDIVLGEFTSNESKVMAVVELKDFKYYDLDKKQNRVGDKRTPVEQGFGYAPKFGGNCRWVLISNFNEIRLYDKNDENQYERFYIEDLEDDFEFKRFLYLLSKENILDRKLDNLIDLKIKEEEKIEREFYTKYKTIRSKIVSQVIEDNRTYNADVLIEKSQKLLDRFLFIAFCEDKNIIPANSYKTMVLSSNENVTKHELFTMLCRNIDKGNKQKGINKFNGGLFKYDEILDDLVLDDVIFTELITLADYDFNTDVDENILGRIFEQSISDLEELKNDALGIETDKKKGKRKKDGVFYTPSRITRGIVEKSIGEYLNDKKLELGYEKLPELTDESIETQRGLSAKAEKHLAFWREYRSKVLNIKVIDPACGSGAFLIAAYDYLKKELDEINDRIADLKGRTQELFDGDEMYDASRENEYLIKCLYGVDLNPESVEISKLSLWLRTLTKDKPLTNLDDNIKSGNSITEFNFQKEFSEVFAKGGFDVVIGNPPYVKQERLKDVKHVLEEKYLTFMGTADLYCYFYELGINVLRSGGILGYITSNKWLRAKYGTNIRQFLNQYYIIEIEDHGSMKQFSDAEVNTNIIIVKKINRQNSFVKIILTEKNGKTFETSQSNFSENGYLFLDNRLLKVKEKIDSFGKTLEEWNIEINRGILTGLNDAFIIDKEKYNEFVKKDRKNKEILVPLLRGRDINRYSKNYADLYLINVHNGYKIGMEKISEVNIDNYIFIKEHLNSFEPKLSKRSDKGKTPYNLRNCAYLNDFKNQKIIYGETVTGASFFLDNDGFIIDKTAFMLLGESIKYILALLNSRFIEFAYKTFYAGIILSSSGFQYNKEYLKKLPIIVPTQEQEEYLTNLADKMLESKEKLSKLNKLLELAINDKNYEIQLELKEKIEELNEEILDTDYAIDSYVYDMYGITAEERALIEG
ncbi:MAG: N-6 DNA methylase [Gemella haemolysans]|uniref:Eco57I restriction-modification methylase domain-containing protein n=1 Tax=Gemella haemolysans TaxID=1379 RepID=UPI002906923D|nr:N-6 DNA methylase [Gemella haemolysans]MDU6573193.1 N-6 DNA methylase [Gemella haemolysans]